MKTDRSGFSMIELVVVVLVIGILMGIATPRLLRTSRAATIEATVQHLNTIVVAAEMYRHENGDWPPSALPGQMPAGLEAYLRPDLFATPCPVGGRYDWDGPDSGAARVKIMGVEADESTFSEIDLRIDDGDLATGGTTTNALGANERLRIQID